MKKNILIILLVSLLLVFSACSSDNKNTEEKIIENSEIESEVEVEVESETQSENTEIENNESEIERKDIDETETKSELDNIVQTLSGTGSYNAPPGPHSVELTLELDSDGVVTSFEASLDSSNGISNNHFNNYKSGLDTVIIGKKIDEIEFPEIISGSSLTSKGFQNALDDMKAN